MKKKVALLGASGLVGELFIQMLQDHPLFELQHICASDQRVGSSFKGLIYEDIMQPKSCDLVFSALPANVAKDIEPLWAKESELLVTNSSYFRTHPKVPIVIPEINAHKIRTIDPLFKIVANPNCVVAGISLALAPLIKSYEIDRIYVSTMQALSGAGRGKIDALEICSNVFPFIEGEEEKIESEPLKIFEARLEISAQCHRINIPNGHFASLNVLFKEDVDLEDIYTAWEHFRGERDLHNLPNYPTQPIKVYRNQMEPNYLNFRSENYQMEVGVGNLRAKSKREVKFHVLSNNLIRGACGNALLIAEAFSQHSNCQSFLARQ